MTPAERRELIEAPLGIVNHRAKGSASYSNLELSALLRAQERNATRRIYRQQQLMYDLNYYDLHEGDE